MWQLNLLLQIIGVGHVQEVQHGLCKIIDPSIRMSTRNYDSSMLTQFRRARALYAYNRNMKAAVAAGTSVQREQPSMQLNDVYLQRVTGGPVQIVSQGIVEAGCATCNGSVTSALGYPANSSSQ
jgi:hypothetical protein